MAHTGRSRHTTNCWLNALNESRRGRPAGRQPCCLAKPQTVRRPGVAVRVGIAAIAHENYRLLKALLTLRIRVDRHNPEAPDAGVLNHLAVLGADAQRMLPEAERQSTPLSNHLFDLLRHSLKELLADEELYEAGGSTTISTAALKQHSIGSFPGYDDLGGSRRARPFGNDGLDLLPTRAMRHHP